jgi:DNA-binding transcriptional ArsR family regulator
MKKFRKYAEEFPDEVKIAVASLDNSVRQAILILLSKKAELSFSDIMEELGLDKLLLNFHLKNLFSAGLTDHYYRHELGNQKYSYYSITKLGERILANLSKAFIPPLPFRKVQMQKTFIEKYAPLLYDTNIGQALIRSDKKPAIITTIAPSGVKTTSEHAPSINLGQYTQKEEDRI